MVGQLYYYYYCFGKWIIHILQGAEKATLGACKSVNRRKEKWKAYGRLEYLPTFQKFMDSTIEFLLYIRYGTEYLAVFIDGTVSYL